MIGVLVVFVVVVLFVADLSEVEPPKKKESGSAD
jgi:hypothetical protein